MTNAAVESAIITVTYNCEGFIEDFLASVKDQLMPKAQAHLIIIDNLSSDNTVGVVNKYIEENSLSNQITLLPQSKNLGFGAGCNAGVAAAKSFSPKYYWFLNPDTLVFPETRPKLVEFLEQNSRAGFVCSQLEDKSGNPRSSGFRFPSVVSELCASLRLGVVDRIFANKKIAIPVQTEPHQAGWLTGASFLVTAEAFDRLNGFDETFFLYFEEVDLCFRANQHNIERWVNPESKIYHIAGASTGISSGKKAIKRRPQYWFDSRRHYYIKNHGHLYFALTDLITLIGLSIFKVRQAIQRKESNDPPHLLLDYARNSLFLSPKGKR